MNDPIQTGSEPELTATPVPTPERKLEFFSKSIVAAVSAGKLSAKEARDLIRAQKERLALKARAHPQSF